MGARPESEREKTVLDQIAGFCQAEYMTNLSEIVRVVHIDPRIEFGTSRFRYLLGKRGLRLREITECWIMKK